MYLTKEGYTPKTTVIINHAGELSHAGDHHQLTGIGGSDGAGVLLCWGVLKTGCSYGAGGFTGNLIFHHREVVMIQAAYLQALYTTARRYPAPERRPVYSKIVVFYPTP